MAAPLCQNRRVDAGGFCRVWWADLCSLRERHADLLSPVERQRRDRYANAEARDRFTLAAALLRLAAAHEVGQPPDRVEIGRSCYRCAEPHGRPTLPDHDLHVSVSHSGRCITVAVTDHGEVGVDVEEVKPFDYEPMLRSVLAPDEAGTVHSREDFFAYWTRKESVLKATGEGLRMPMPEVVVSPPTQPPRLVRHGRRQDLVASMAGLAPPQGYLAVVTALTGAPISADERDAAPLLSGA